MRFYLNSVQFRPTFVFQWITFVSIASIAWCKPIWSTMMDVRGNIVIISYWMHITCRLFNAPMHRCNRRRTLQRLAIVQCSGWIRGRGGATGQASCTKYLYWHFCICVFLCVFTYFCIVQAGLGVEGRGGGSEQRCMYDGYFWYICIFHICTYLCVFVFVYLWICVFVFFFDCSSQIRGRVLGRGQAWWAGCTKSTKLKGFEARGPAIIESCVQFRVTLRISQHIWRSLWTDQSIWRGLPNHISRKSPH